MIENLIFNSEIWEKTNEDSKLYLMEQTRRILLKRDLEFSKNEPFASLIQLLFRNIPEDNANSSKLITTIKSMLLSELTRSTNAKDIAVFTKYLRYTQNNFIILCNFLQVISKYQETITKKSIFIEYIQYNEDEIKQNEDLITSLFFIINDVISQKLQIHENNENNEREILEDILSHCTYILFSLNLNTTLKKTSPNLPEEMKGKRNLRQYIEKAQAECAIIEFLVLVLNSEEKHERGYLGEKVYHKIIERVFNSSNKDYCLTIYKTILKNAFAFEVNAFNKLFIDLEKPHKPLPFKAKDLGQHIAKYLCRAEYLANTEVKDYIEKIVLKFFKSTMKKCINGKNGKEDRKTITRLLKRIEKADPLIFIQIYLELTRNLTDCIKLLQAPESIYILLQILYTLENYTIKEPIILSNKKFPIILAQLIIILDKTENLYFWQPSFDLTIMQYDVPIKDSKNVVREGGVVRILLRLLFASLAKLPFEHIELLIRSLYYFIFHDEESWLKLVNHLGKEFERPTEFNPCFMEYSLAANKKLKHSMKTKAKIFIGERCEVQRKIINGLTQHDNDVYQSTTFKLISLFHYLSQTFIYDTLRIDSYADIIKPQHFDQFNITSKGKEVLRIIGRLLNEYSNRISITKKLNMNQIRIDITQCHTDIDTFHKGNNDVMCIPKKKTSQIILCSSPMHKKERDSETILGEELKGNTFKESFQSLINKIVKIWNDKKCSDKKCSDKKCSVESYYEKVGNLILMENNLVVVQAGLCNFVANNLNFIANSLNKSLAQRKSLHYTRREGIREELLKINRMSESTTSLIRKAPLDLSSDYEELKNLVLKDKVLKRVSIIDKKIYKLVNKQYMRILSKCPLYKKQIKKKHYIQPKSCFKTFVTLSSAHDNLGRAIRLKPMKDYLKCESIVKGIRYMKRYFLKKILQASILDKTKRKLLFDNQKFLFPKEELKILLKGLISFGLSNLKMEDKMLDAKSTLISGLNSYGKFNIKLFSEC